MKKSQLKKIIIQCINEVYLDRHGSSPNRPKSVRFTGDGGEEKYNDHMGFDASIPDDVFVPEDQIKSVKKLLDMGFVVTGHANWPFGEDGKKYIEILMTKRTPTGGSMYRDVDPKGKY